MNLTGIEWTDLTWNPITGCKRLCMDELNKIYCYAYYMAQRQAGRNGYDKMEPFKPTFHPNRLLEPYHRKRPAKIFTCSMGDMFDSGVPDLWRELVFQVMYRTPQHTYQVLTKQPLNVPRYEDFELVWPSNMWLGVSVDGRTSTTEKLWELYEDCTFPWMTFVSFEPLLGQVDLEELDIGLKWAIIGAKTGPRPKQPEWEWVQEIIDWANEYDIPLFFKNNLELPDGVERRQEFPTEVRA